MRYIAWKRVQDSRNVLREQVFHTARIGWWGRRSWSVHFTTTASDDHLLVSECSTRYIRHASIRSARRGSHGTEGAQNDPYDVTSRARFGRQIRIPEGPLITQRRSVIALDVYAIILYSTNFASRYTIRTELHVRKQEEIALWTGVEDNGSICMIGMVHGA